MKKLLLIILIVAPIQLQAAPIDFNFSFSNTVGNVAGTVSGVISGLVDNAAGQSATSVILTSYPAGLLGVIPSLDATTWTSVIFNSFDVFGGAITAATFAADNRPDTGALLGLNAVLGGCAFCPVSNVLTFNHTVTSTANHDGFGGATYSAVPEPSTFVLMGLGLLGLGLTYRRRLQILTL